MSLNWSRLGPLDRSATGWLSWFVVGVMLPGLAAFLLVIEPGQLAHAWDAAHGGGQLGTLHVASKECGYHRVGGYQCTGLHGSFESDDGSTRLAAVFLDGIPSGAGVGSDVSVRYVGGHPPVAYVVEGSREWLLISALLLAALLGLGAWVLTVYARLHDRYLPGMLRPWTRPPVLRDERDPKKTGHRRRRRKKKRRG